MSDEERSWDPAGADVPRWVVPAALVALALLLALVALAVASMPATP